ncbi:MAG: MMPL family transporter [Planctomycetaceae bacterium]|nr:MMPL family transporter [Planctomycetaceae bacterium]
MPPDASEHEQAPRLAAAADWLVNHRQLLFVIGILLVVAAILPASRLKLDESIESFYAPDDPYLLDYLDSKEAFGGDEFVFVAYHDPELLEPEGLKRVQTFADQLSVVPGIRSESTQCLATMLAPPDANLAVRLFLRFPRTHENLLNFSRRILIGDDNETTGIVLRLLPQSESPIPRRETFARIRELADAHDPPAFVTGEAVMTHDMFRYVEQDGALLGIATSGLLILIILLLFRSLRWMVLPLLLVHASLLWTKALLVLSGTKLSMVSSILTSLITIIGIATVMHVTVRFRELRNSMDRFAAFRQAFIDLAPATFWSCVTTAVGFGALLSSGITPVRSFGMMVALGTMLILVAGGLLLPGGVLIGQLDADPHNPPAEKRLLGMLSKISHGVQYRSTLLLTLLTAISLLAAVGMSRLRVETDFSKNFRANSPIIKSIHFFEDRLGGVGNWEINFSAPIEQADSDQQAEGEGLDFDFLARVTSIAESLRDLKMSDGTGPTKAVGLSDGVDFIPGLAARSLEQKRSVMKLMQPEFEESLYNAEQGRMRIMLRAREQQPAETKLALIQKAEEVARAEFPDAKATGLYVLLSHLIESLLSDQLVAFGLAAAGILVMMTIAFRSIWIGLVMLVPNTFPILIVIGGMGWLGVPVNIGTAMIASVSMGLTVDSSIHYLIGYRRARAAGLDHYSAIHQTHAGVGRALVFASIALVLGFTVLSLSHFIPLIYFGVLVSIAMLGGLLGDLVLLPLLLYWVPVPLPETTAPSPE